MSVVDERVVKMVFDNSEFTNKIDSAIGSITQLNKTTDQVAENTSGIKAMGKAFEESEISATKAGFHIADVWEKTTRILEYQVANKIVDVSKKIAKAMTFEGVADGFKEYELKMTSVQTIMAGTGESIDVVNKYLEELNKYSDQTIYSFADMTNNIGKFTNAGVKLHDAVAAIKGIANEAARSGANANEASRAMYNFSQALSAGYVKLIDWKSIENANMATKEFKDTLLEVATSCKTVEKDSNGMYKVLTTNAQGKAMDDVVSATKNFNDSLSYQWMTTDVLTKALKIYATDVLSSKVTPAEKRAYEEELRLMGMTDEQIEKFEKLGHEATLAASQIKTFSMLIDTLKEAIGSGWAQTWEIIIGDLEEAKVLWTEVGNVLGGFIDEMSDSRNELLKGWDELGGRQYIIDGLRKAFEGLLAILKPIGEAFNETFKTISKYDLGDFSKNFYDLMTNFITFANDIAPTVKSVAKGIFGVINLGVQFLSAFGKALVPVIGFAWKLVEVLLKVVGSVGEMISTFAKVTGKAKAFEKIFAGMLIIISKFLKTIAPIVQVIETVIVGIINIALRLFTFAFSGIKGLVSLLSTMGKAFNDSMGPVRSFNDIIQMVFDKIITGLDNLRNKTEGISKFFEGVKKVFEAIGSVVGSAFKKIGEVLGGISFEKNGIGGLINLLTALFSGGILIKLSSLGDAIKSFGDIFENFNKRIAAEVLKTDAEAIAILAGSVILVSMIDSERLTASVIAIGGMAIGLAVAMGILMKAVNSFSITNVKKTFSMFGHEIFGTNGPKVVGMAVQLGAISKALLALGTAILEMSFALKNIAAVAESGHLWDSFAVLSLILAELTVVALALSKFSGNKAIKGIGSVVTISLALLVVVHGLNKVSDALSQEGQHIWEALGIVSIILAELTVAAIALGKFGGFSLFSGIGAIEVAAALLIVVQSLKQVSDALKNDGHYVTEALKLVSLMLVELIGATILLGQFGALSVVGGVGAIAAAAALLVVVQSLKQCNDLLKETDNHVWEALGVITASLLSLSVGLNLMTTAIPGALALIIAAEGLVVLSNAFKILSAVITENGSAVWEAFGLIAATLLTLAVGLNLMAGTLGGAAALVIAANGLKALAKAVEMFTKISFGDLVESLIKFGLVILSFSVVTSLLAPLTPAIIAFSVGLTVLSVALGACGLAFTIFSGGAMAVSSALPYAIDAIEKLLGVLISKIPDIIEAIAQGLVIIAQTIVKYGPVFGEAVVEVIRQVMKILYESTYEIGMGVVKIIVAALEVIAQGIPLIVAAVNDIFIAIIKTIAIEIPRLVDAGAKAVVLFVAGLAKAIAENTKPVLDAFALLLEALGWMLLDWIVHLPGISLLIPQSMKDGILQGQSDVAAAAEALINDTTSAMEEAGKKAEPVSKELVDQELDAMQGPDAKKLVNKAEETGEKTVEGMVGKDRQNQLAEGVNGFTNAFSGIFSSDEALSALDMSSIFGEGLSGGFLDGLTSNDGNINNWFGNFSNSINRATNEVENFDRTLRGSNSVLKSHKVAIYDEEGEVTDYRYEYYYATEEVDKNTEAVNNNTNSLITNSGATKEAKNEVKEFADYEEYASGVSALFYNEYKHLYDSLSDDDAINVAKFAVEELAFSLYDASGKANEAAKSVKDSKDYIQEMIEAFTDAKKKIFDSISAVFSGDSFFQEFEVKTEKTMEEMLHAMHTNIDAVSSWSSKLAELGERGVEQGLLQQLAELGPKGYEYVNAFSNASQEQIEEANKLFAQAGVLKNTESNKIIASYANAGLMATLGFRDGMLGEMVQAEAAANSLGVTTLQELKDALGIASPSKETRQIGVYAVEGLRNGLDDRTAWAQVNGVIKMLCQSVIDQVAYFLKFEDFAAFGANIGEGLAQGIRSKEADVRLAALKLSQAAALATTKFNQIHSPSKLYHEYGENIAEGLAEGIEDGSDQAEEAAYNLADLVSSTFSSSNFFNDFDKKVDKTAEGLVNAMQSNVDAVKEWSDNLVKLGERGIEKGLLKQLAELGPRGYEYVHAFVNASDDELKRANELFLEAGKYTLNEIKDEAESIEEVVDETVNEVLQKTSVWDYARGAISAFAMQYWNMYKEIGETDSVYAGIYAIQTLAEKLYFTSYKAKEATGSYEENVVSIEDMINSFLKLKEEAMNTVSSVFSGDNFFKEFELKAEATADSLLAAMKSNVDAVTQWSKEIAELGAKGINEGLLKQLAELGPKSYEYVHAFADASEEQIEEANRLFEESLKLPDSVSDVIIASYANAGLMATEGFKKGLLDNIVEAERESAREFGYSFGDTFLETLEEKFASEEYVEAGRYISEGFAEGIEEGNADVQQVVIAMSEAALETTEEINEINSPSKAYRRLGGYISEGFALGIGDGLDYVNEQALALSNAVRTAIDMVNDIAMNMEDIQPVIKPVVDLSNVTEAARFIGGLNPTQSIAMASSIGIGKENYTADNNNVTAMAPASINVTQNNYSPKALDRYEIYRQTNNLVSQLKGAMA